MNAIIDRTDTIGGANEIPDRLREHPVAPPRRRIAPREKFRASSRSIIERARWILGRGSWGSRVLMEKVKTAHRANTKHGLYNAVEGLPVFQSSPCATATTATSHRPRASSSPMSRAISRRSFGRTPSTVRWKRKKRSRQVGQSRCNWDKRVTLSLRSSSTAIRGMERRGRNTTPAPWLFSRARQISPTSSTATLELLCKYLTYL